MTPTRWLRDTKICWLIGGHDTRWAATLGFPACEASCLQVGEAMAESRIWAAARKALAV